MSIALMFSIIFAFVVYFIQLCRMDKKNPLHLISILLLMFGLGTVYGFFYEGLIVNFEWFKCGVIAILSGTTIWFLAERRKL